MVFGSLKTLEEASLHCNETAQERLAQIFSGQEHSLLNYLANKQNLIDSTAISEFLIGEAVVLIHDYSVTFKFILAWKHPPKPG